MRAHAKFAAFLLMPMICAALLGCAIVDQYSGRAIVYNLEAEQAQDQALLLNIVRAYLQRPMQFTTVSTITGVASASGGAQYSLPTNVPFRPPTQGATGIAAIPPLPTWLFSGSMSGGPAFTVPVLDTQEFYQGILKAIPGQLWDLYIQANYPPDLLFNLFVEKVVMQRTDGRCHDSDHLPQCEFVFINSVTTGDIQIDLFQALTNYLLALGLTTSRPTPETVPVNAPNTENVNVRYVGALGSDKTTTRVLAPPGGSTAADSSPGQYKVCFAPQDEKLSGCIGSSSLCDAKPPSSPGTTKKPLLLRDATKRRPPPPRMCGNLIAQEPAGESPRPALETGEIRGSGSASVNVFASEAFIQQLLTIAGDDKCPNAEHQLDACLNVKRQLEIFFFRNPERRRDSVALKITISMRHTEGMIYYVGSLVRRSLGHVPGWDQRDILVRLDDPYRTHTEALCRDDPYKCAYIFHVRLGSPEPGDIIGINYEGQSYSIPGSNSPEPGPDSLIDLSSLTFDILKQLIALNSSAKSLPQSSVVTTVGGQ
ncbi:MAG TPA: hypothetical protein VMF12_09160 [Xanthobacteraceae bacterium]|nr:hypothetical protein [Xanthobacteraceae bacterium]